jgi:hypothetical protein
LEKESLEEEEAEEVEVKQQPSKSARCSMEESKS